MDISFLVELGLIITAAGICGYLAKLFKQPMLLAYLIAGIIIGPFGISQLGITIGNIPLGIKNMETIRLFSELGIAFLMFSVGIESDFSKLKSFGKFAVFGTILQVFLTFVITFFLSNFFHIFDFTTAIYFAVMLSFSSTVVAVKLLSDKFQLSTLHGRIMLAFLLMQDLLIIVVVPLFSSLSSFSFGLIFTTVLNAIILLIIALILNRFIFLPLFTYSLSEPELSYLLSVSVSFIFIGLSVFLNLPLAIGAFIGGVALSTLPYNIEIYSKIKGIRDFFVTLFFVSLGMQLNLFTVQFAPIVLIFVVLSVFLIKPAVYYLITILFGYGHRIATTVALSLTQISEFSFILLNIAYYNNLVSENFFALMVTAIAVSMLTTPYFFNYAPKIASFTSRYLERIPKKHRSFFNRKLMRLSNVDSLFNNHTVLFGAGVMGSALMDAIDKQDLVIVDNDTNVIHEHLQNGYFAIYGQADSEEIWHKINLNKAKIIILALPDIDAQKTIIEYVRTGKKKPLIIARAQYFTDALALYKQGADFVVMPYILGANLVARTLRQYYRNPNKKLFSLKKEYLAYLEQKAREEMRTFGSHREKQNIFD